MIRKIIVGRDPKNAMAYVVGMPAGRGNVTMIELDEKLLAKKGIRRYIVWIMSPEDGTMPWKAIEDMPVIVEYDCDFS